MTESQVTRAAATLWRHWSDGTRIDGLPADCRPADRRDGYAIQSAIVALSGGRRAGWKIAATSTAGQRHIGVDGPLAGPLLARTRLPPGGRVPFRSNHMKVAEGEFAFELGEALPPGGAPYSVDRVMAAVRSLAPAIEIPDSRYDDYARAGAPQLIADCACACWVAAGDDAPEAWRDMDLAAHRVRALRNGTLAAEGRGANVLGDPRVALTWIANELSAFGPGLDAGDLVITGTCVPPVAIAPGDALEMDFGPIGRLTLLVGD